MFEKKKKGGGNSCFFTSKVTITFFVPVGAMARNNGAKEKEKYLTIIIVNYCTRL